MQTTKAHLREHEHNEFCAMKAPYQFPHFGWGLFAQFRPTPRPTGRGWSEYKGVKLSRWDPGCVDEWEYLV